MTQADLGTLVGRSRNTIDNWENGRSDPPGYMIDRIAGALGVTWQWLENRTAGTITDEELMQEDQSIRQSVGAPITSRLEQLVRGSLIRAGFTIAEGPELQVGGDRFKPDFHVLHPATGAESFVEVRGMVIGDLARRLQRQVEDATGVPLFILTSPKLPEELLGTKARPTKSFGRAEQAVPLPRDLRAMAHRFLAEAHEAGADDAFLRYARHSLEDPELAEMYAGGLDEEGHPMTAEEQRDDYEAIIDALRLIMKRRLARAQKR